MGVSPMGCGTPQRWPVFRPIKPERSDLSAARRPTIPRRPRKSEGGGVLGPSGYTHCVRKIARYALGFLTVLSLLLAIASAALWIQSRIVDLTFLHFGQKQMYVRSGTGELSIQINTIDWTLWAGKRPAGWSRVRSDWFGRRVAQQLGAEVSFWNRLGFAARRFEWAQEGMVSELRIIVVPYWFLLALATPLPARLLLRGLSSRRRRQLAAAGRCTTCGYDLRGTPARCPECGSTPQPQAKA
jgi:hypothetical protein